MLKVDVEMFVDSWHTHCVRQRELTVSETVRVANQTTKSVCTHFVEQQQQQQAEVFFVAARWRRNRKNTHSRRCTDEGVKHRIT